jgi:hypothetical protein
MLSSGVIVFLDRWLINLDALSFNDRSNLDSTLAGADNRVRGPPATYSLLELSQVCRAERVGFGNYRNKVDP